MIKKSQISNDQKKKAPKINLALIVVNTNQYHELKSKKKSTDKIIPKVERLLINDQSIKLAFSQIITDSEDHINKVLVDLMKDDKIDSIIFSGGMGYSEKEITFETIVPRFEKVIEGFGELFRSLSYNEIGTPAMLYRANAGILRIKKKGKVIILLPSSLDAVTLAIQHIIIPELSKLFYLVNKED
ncbi:MAG: molybdenum cofactor biosynthesis protein B [Promethearchaeota archaeon]